jgi:hypothetical protein
MEGLPTFEELQKSVYQKENELSIWLPERFMADENEYEDDILYLKRMYPDIGREIAEFVEEECDKMEYAGSMMFDQYPDKLSVMKLVDDIYDQVKYHDENSPYLKWMVQIMLCDEMHHRRSRYHRKCRYFF